MSGMQSVASSPVRVARPDMARSAARPLPRVGELPVQEPLQGPSRHPLLIDGLGWRGQVSPCGSGETGMPVQTVPTRPTPGTYVLMAACTGVAAVLLGTLYLIYRDMAVTGGCGSRYGPACSGKQSAHIFAALVVMPASAACLMFLNWVVFRPYRRGHEAYRLVIPLLLASSWPSASRSACGGWCGAEPGPPQGADGRPRGGSVVHGPERPLPVRQRHRDDAGTVGSRPAVLVAGVSGAAFRAPALHPWSVHRLSRHTL